jgi:hypothetical protein
MNAGILAYLSGRVAKQQELLATEGLTYLLNQSEACRAVMRQLARRGNCELPEVVTYRAEVSGEGQERPDVVGVDRTNKEVVIIEGKFDAGLTDNQPNSYVSRLGPKTSGLILFVVPELRMQRLWHEVQSRAQAAGLLDEAAPVADNIWRCRSIGSRSLMMVSWQELLEQMMHAAQSAKDVISSDIHQLQNLCSKIEGDAFLPFKSDELTGVALPKRHRDLCNLVDAITDHLINNGAISVAGLKATPIRDGFIRYVWLTRGSVKVGASIGLRYSLWQESELSPIWLGPQQGGLSLLHPILEEQAVSYGTRIAEEAGLPFLPLPVHANLELSELVDQCADVVCAVCCRLVSDQVAGG